MKNENERKGLLSKLFKSKKGKKGCCDFEIEEITEENLAAEKNTKPKDKGSCCKN